MAVRGLGPEAVPLTGDLDSLIARRARLEGAASPDSLAALDRRIDGMELYRKALADRIAILPGAVCSVSGMFRSWPATRLR